MGPFTITHEPRRGVFVLEGKEGKHFADNLKHCSQDAVEDAESDGDDSINGSVQKYEHASRRPAPSADTGTATATTTATTTATARATAPATATAADTADTASASDTATAADTASASSTEASSAEDQAKALPPAKRTKKTKLTPPEANPYNTNVPICWQLKGAVPSAGPKQDAYPFKFTCGVDVLTYAALNHYRKHPKLAQQFMEKTPNSKKFLGGIKNMARGKGWYFPGLEKVRSHLPPSSDSSPETMGFTTSGTTITLKKAIF